MACKRKSIIHDPNESDEEIFDSDFTTTVLTMLNGYCKVNLVVPQTSTFYTKDSLLPINAEVDDGKLNNDTLNNSINNTPSCVTNMLRNVMINPETSNDGDKAYNLDDNEKLEQELYNHEQKPQTLKKKMKKMNNLSTSQMSNIHKNTENNKQNTTHKSQCPICFEFYPTLQIEAHASECNI